MRHPRHWIYRLLGVVALAVIAMRLQGDAHAQALGGGGNYGLVASYAPRVVMLTASYVATPADCGTTFSNAGAGAVFTVTLPPSPPLGCTIGAYVFNGGFGMVVQNQTGETIQVAGTSTATSGNITYAAGLGLSITLQKVISNKWGTTANEGAAPTIN